MRSEPSLRKKYGSIELYRWLQRRSAFAKHAATVADPNHAAYYRLKMATALCVIAALEADLLTTR